MHSDGVAGFEPIYRLPRSTWGAISEDITHVFTLRNGRLVYATGYRERTKDLEAAGHSA